jgi:putative oxidoreductase
LAADEPITKEKTMTTDARSFGTTDMSASRGRLATVGLWVLQVGAAAMFLMAGTMKLIGNPMMVQLFGTIGIGQWFRYLTGTIEVVGAILLLVPSLAVFGAIPLAMTMVGAIITHLFIVGGNPAAPIMLLAATATIAWARWRSL